MGKKAEGGYEEGPSTVGAVERQEIVPKSPENWMILTRLEQASSNIIKGMVGRLNDISARDKWEIVFRSSDDQKAYYDLLSRRAQELVSLRQMMRQEAKSPEDLEFEEIEGLEKWVH